MQVLALYDIHGNAAALDAVLADRRAADADAVLVGGDAVSGPQPVEVLARLDALPGTVVWIRGNGERELWEAPRGSIAVDASMPVRVAARTLKALGLERAQRLAALPLTAELDGVLYCHATPRRDDEMLTRSSPNERYEAALSGVEARTVVAGHTHQHDDRRVGRWRFVNAGSVGFPYEGDPAARWLLVENGEPVPMSTGYDVEAAVAAIRASGFPADDMLAMALADPADPISITAALESTATNT